MFSDLPLALAVALFAGAAVVVWIAGTRLARYADAIGARTGLERGFLGLLLLGGVTSLPELSVAATSALQGTPALSVNNVLGAAALNVVVLAIADAAVARGRPLASLVGSPNVIVQGVLGIALFTLVIAPTLAGDRLVLGLGAWSWAMLAFFCTAVWLLSRSRAGERWKPSRASEQGRGGEGEDPRTLRRLLLGAAAAGGAILAAGFVLARTGDVLARETGLGEGFFGAVFLAFSTALPEISTVVAAVRLRQFDMAVGDVLGTNLFNATIVVLVDALHGGGPVLVEAGRFAAFGALLAMAVTAIFLVGLLERRERAVLGMGAESLAVMAAYAGGLVVLYQLR